MFDPFSKVPGFDLEAAILARAERCGLSPGSETVSALAVHARAVLRENDTLHLTSIIEPLQFLERHLGEAFEGAAMLEDSTEGALLDLGSGNGYPGLPLALTRPGLRLAMAEASMRKADFLRVVLRDIAAPSGAHVIEGQVQRAGDLEGYGPFRLIVSRAMGGWAKILPRMHGCMTDDGELLVWAGPEVETIARRVVWKRFELVDRKPLPERDQSWIWRLKVSV